MDVFKGLKEQFNIDEATADIKEAVATANEKIEEIQEGISTQKYTIEDKNYLKMELQDLIATDREVMESLRDQLVNGAPSQLYVAYSTLSKSVRENIAKLIDLEKQITDYQVVESNEEFRERSLATKERLANKRLENKAAQQPGVPGQITQNNTYIFSPREQFETMKKTKSEIEAPVVENPEFDLS